MQRKNAILISAGDHFGRFGFRGSSLRDIARDAGVSLTLVNHHFGSKAHLLSATIIAQREILQQRDIALRRVTMWGPGTFTLQQIVEAFRARRRRYAASRQLAPLRSSRSMHCLGVDALIALRFPEIPYRRPRTPRRFASP